MISVPYGLTSEESAACAHLTIHPVTFVIIGETSFIGCRGHKQKVTEKTTKWLHEMSTALEKKHPQKCRAKHTGTDNKELDQRYAAAQQKRQPTHSTRLGE